MANDRAYNISTIERNKLIAKFMKINQVGEEVYFIPKYKREVSIYPLDGTEMSALYKTEDLMYNKSWDWLNPVIEKIKNFSGTKSYINVWGQKEEARIIINNFTITPNYAFLKVELARAYNEFEAYDSKIESVYKIVSDFIYWLYYGNRI